MGDIILTQPVISLLFEAYPDSEIHYICKAQFAELVRCLDKRISVLVYEKSIRWHKLLTHSRYDLVLDLHAKLASWLIKNLVNANIKRVYDKQRGIRKAIVSGARDLAIESTTRLYFSALRGIVSEDQIMSVSSPRIGLPEQTSNLDLLPDFATGKTTIAIFPGAAHPTKIYPLRYLDEMIKMTGRDYRFLLFGSKQENHLCLRLADSNPETAINLCGALSFSELNRVLARCDLVISGDSGPMHLAAALNKKQIAIFGSTHPRLGFAPQNENAILLCLDLPCQPCSLHGVKRCPLGHFDCMMKIKPDVIYQIIQKAIG
ncbi:MAG: glycosyltransferase family 9 protein [Candidatus Cloacimonadaceae bacterium]|nr:glycosyltransferase family 9 protein [Candidatus Cloacimonadaceae bacterium]